MTDKGAAAAGATVMVSAFPLSKQFQQRFEANFGATPLYLNLADLRRRSLPRTLRELASLRGARLLLACETREGPLLQPLLETLSLAIRPVTIEVVRPDLSRSTVSSWHALPALASLAGASIRGQIALAAGRRELRRLVQDARATPRPNASKRVLYLNGNLWIGLKAGGSIGHVAGVVNELQASGYEVEMATFVDPIGVDSAVVAKLLLPPAPFGLPFETNQYRFQRVMTRHLGQLQPGDVGFVYQRMSAGNYSGVTVSRRLEAPLVLEYNGSEVWVASNWGTPLVHERVALLAEDASLRHAQLIVTVSEISRQELLSRGVEPERVVMHPNGVDPVLFDAEKFDHEAIGLLRAGYGIEPDAVVVGFVGTFGRWHGAEVLARAIARIALEHPGFLEAQRVSFLFVGDGLGLPDVRRIIEASDAGARTRFTGLVAQAEAPVHLAACDILVSPHVPNADGTPFFGSPTKLFEYMAMGKAIVASRLTQIGEVLEPSLDARDLPAELPSEARQERALTTDPGSERELADALRFIVCESEWRALLGRNARAAVLSQYTWKHHVDAFLARLEEIRRR